MPVSDEGQQSTSAQQGNRALDVVVRWGLVVYGVVHLVVAWLAVQLAFGDKGGKTSQTGALAQLGQTAVGGLTLWVAAGGFAGLALWQAVEALFGHEDEDGGKRAFKRAASGVKVVVYGFLGVTALRLATGDASGSSGGRTDTWTARLMSAPGGQVLVGLVGVAVLGAAGYLVYKGLSRSFTDRLDSGATASDRRTPIVTLGAVGYVAKGVALGAVGVLFVVAAVQHKAKKSGGLDQALQKLLEQPFGTPVLLAVAFGFACYGVFCFFWARHLDR